MLSVVLLIVVILLSGQRNVEDFGWKIGILVTAGIVALAFLATYVLTSLGWL